jgi:hypothetical protein
MFDDDMKNRFGKQFELAQKRMSEKPCIFEHPW